jgi:hypothetical protein
MLYSLPSILAQGMYQTVAAGSSIFVTYLIKEKKQVVELSR